MSGDLLTLAVLVVIVVAGSALCSGVEAALLTVNPVRVHELAARSQPIAGGWFMLWVLLTGFIGLVRFVP